MDLTGVKAAVEEVNEKTLPAVDEIARQRIDQLARELHGLLERLNGATITATLTLNIPPKVY
jgi:hypothetical protein